MNHFYKKNYKHSVNYNYMLVINEVNVALSQLNIHKYK